MVEQARQYIPKLVEKDIDEQELEMLLQPEKEHYELPCPDKDMLTDIIQNQYEVKQKAESQYASIKKTLYDHLKFKQVDTVTILPYSL